MIFTKFIFIGERPSLKDIDGLHLSKYRFSLKFCKGKKVLELGCGAGYGSKYLAKGGAKQVIAYDLDKKVIKFAKQNFNDKKVIFRLGDVESLKLKSEYNVVIAFELIEHLNQPEKLLSLTKRALVRNGIFILSTPNRENSSYDGDKPSNPHHVKEYYPLELKQLLKKYFSKIELYGIVLKNEKRQQEDMIRKNLRWRIANSIAKKRWIRKVINYLPEYPKRIFTGEAKLFFSLEDFSIRKDGVHKADDLLAVCQ